MFLEYLLVVVLHTVFGVEGPRLRGMFGTELRDPVIGELGADEGPIASGELLQLLKGGRLRIGRGRVG
ncbi:hypothetical protein BST37_22020 [Mycobacterium noviomagense]|uniref:Secreted protein n=1 Tax=Mycobacterium noviomagense TaxID=459858 RepID=A0ABX3SYV1_9MYCO|nr:hypothetical protein BST37_22020 [Mycobacterium noviomagense]